MLTVAVLGAGGFIGSRTVEALHLGGVADVRGVVRSYAGLARLSRFDLDWRIADACDRPALRAALAGCDVVVHAVAPDLERIPRAAEAVYRAARDAGVRRLVYLSSASVHGQDPTLGANEESALSDRQAIPYNNAKVRAEGILRRLRGEGPVELVLLRPGVVYGPRSRWTGGLADALLEGTAYLVDGGRGICNAVYVDNLVHAISLALAAPAADREAFLIGDQEEITWADFYRPLARALGIDSDRIPHVAPPPSTSRTDQASGRRPVVRLILRSIVPASVRRAASAARASWGPPHPPAATWKRLPARPPAATLEMALLHRCGYKFPLDKAARVLNYRPVVAFPEASRRAIAWLAFAGYPVNDPDTPESEAPSSAADRARGAADVMGPGP